MSIVITDQRAPRWIRELARFVPLHALVLVHGNVLDHVAYPVTANAEEYWTESDLTGFLCRFLKSLGYDVVGVLDPIDGLSFDTEQMQQQYAASGGNRARSQDRPEPNQSQRRAASPKLTEAVDGIRRALQNRETASAFVVVHGSRLVLPCPHK